MENRRELFDLHREKRELDAFLSTIEEMMVSSLPGGAIPSSSLPFSAENKIVPEPDLREPSGLELEIPPLEMESASGPVEDKSVSETTLREPSGLELEIPPLEMESTSGPVEDQSVSESALREPSGAELGIPPLELEETGLQPGCDEKAFVPGDRESHPELTSTMVIKPPEESSAEREATASYPPAEEEIREEALPEVGTDQGNEPPDSDEIVRRFDETALSGASPASEYIETITRFDETAKSDEPVLAEEIEPEEKAIAKKTQPEKKTKKTGVYDFAPEKTSSGIGKWIWIGMAIILFVALFVGYFLFSPDRGGKMLNVIKSYIPLSMNNQGAASPTVSGISLIQVRQKLVYNDRLGKNIRVLEGIAENLTPHSVSRIKIAANLYNAEGVLLASEESFGGNIIIDEKLESMDAKEILAALKDVKTMEDRVPPKGQIPFMSVFTSEPAGGGRLSVLPVDLKKH